MTRVTQTRLLAVAALLVAGGALTYISFSNMGENLVYYVTPDELLQKGPAVYKQTVRLGGLVQTESVDWNATTLELHFKVGMLADKGSKGVVVHATGAPPQMFQQGIGAVVEGSYDGQVFHADRVMVKHSNEYRPPAPGERPKDVYGTLAPGDE